MKKALWWAAALITSTGCSKLSTIPYPGQTPETWCVNHHCVNIDLGFTQFVLSTPTSSFFVYFLGIMTIAIGIYFLKTRGSEQSRLWWGIALLFWGAGAIVAGTSYQAFSYEIKCAGKSFCSWTSWWEIFYLLFSTLSMNTILIAVSHSSTQGLLKKILCGYALVNTMVYSVLCLYGAFVADTFLVSFELMILFTGPNFIILTAINLKNYLKEKAPLEGTLLSTWLLMAVVMILYYSYLLSGFGQSLWQKGIWFSANDVLHIALIFWMIFIYKKIGKQAKDTEK